MAFWLSYLGALKEILTAPFRNTNILWQLAPVIILWMIIEIYFDTHKREQLGWNTAIGNSISLSWISLAAIQQLFASKSASLYSGITHFKWSTFFLILVFLLYAIFIAFISFMHSFSPEVTYVLAYPTIVYFLSIVAILFGSGVIIPNKWIFLALATLWAFFGILKVIGYYLVPESSDDE